MEDPGLVRLRDSDPCVRHRELDSTLQTQRSDLHRAARRSELDGIRDQVQQHLLELALVRLDLACRARVGLDPNLLLRCERLDGADDLLHHRTDRNRLQPQLHLAGFDL